MGSLICVVYVSIYNNVFILNNQVARGVFKLDIVNGVSWGNISLIVMDWS